MDSTLIFKKFACTNMWTKEATCILIDLYKLNDSLWKSTSPFYRNKQKRNEALLAIASTVTKIRPNTTVEDVRNKINGIRTQYLAEINKLMICNVQGKPVEPALWCFDKLSFLKPFTQPKQNYWSPAQEKNSVAPVAQPILTRKSDSFSIRQPSAFQLGVENDNIAYVEIKEETDDDIEIIEEEEDVLNIEDGNYANRSVQASVQSAEVTSQQSPTCTAILSSPLPDKSSKEEDRLRQLLIPNGNVELTLIRKADVVKRKSDIGVENGEIVEEKKKKMEEAEKKDELDDSIAIFGKFVMSQMRSVTDKVLLIKLKHTIQNAITEAQLKQIEVDNKSYKIGDEKT